MIHVLKVFVLSLALCGSLAFADEAELKQELAVRDSVMQVQGDACTVEKDSLRAVIETEKAKSENWERATIRSKRTMKPAPKCSAPLSV